MTEKEKRLLELLADMDVPETRRLDIGWLSRNLAIRNADHEKFDDAMSVIREMARTKI